MTRNEFIEEARNNPVDAIIALFDIVQTIHGEEVTLGALEEALENRVAQLEQHPA